MKLFRIGYIKKLKQIISVLLSLLFLAGCGRSELYSGLSEKEVSHMQAILLRQGIDCDKVSEKDETYGLVVSKNQLANAVDILNGFGYPKDNYADMGELFKKEGLVSSPMEERVRYIYALSQEVGKTISKIDGVTTARVHIVLPDNDPLSEYFRPSSASVFVRYRQTMDFTDYAHKIKQLVVNSIEGLKYEKVTVLPFPVEVVSVDKTCERIMGIEVISSYSSRLRFMVFTLVSIIFLTSGCSIVLYRRLIRKTSPDTDQPEIKDQEIEIAGIQ